MARLHVLITGRVQGVGFRWFVKRTAVRLDLAGWVRNRPDGSVEVAAEGASEAMIALRRALAEGPDGAHVTEIAEVRAESLDTLTRPFAITR